MDLKLINQVAGLDDFPPTIRMNDLDINKRYKVYELKLIKTKEFGYAVVAVILEIVQDGAMKKANVFLPSRIAKVFRDNEQLAPLQDLAMEDQLYIHYLSGQYNKFEFITVS